MTRSRTTIAQRANEIYAIIANLGQGWHTRSDIARLMGKPHLTPFDVAALEALAENGRVIAEQHEIDSPIPVRWEYKIKEN
ncbi:MAG: hypothetical protein ABI947_14385 [Chloroflexota bacterium]